MWIITRYSLHNVGLITSTSHFCPVIKFAISIGSKDPAKHFLDGSMENESYRFTSLTKERVRPIQWTVAEMKYQVSVSTKREGYDNSYIWCFGDLHYLSHVSGASPKFSRPL